MTTTPKPSRRSGAAARRLLIAVGLFCALLLVTAPRFDQSDVGPLSELTGTEEGGNLGDARQYIQYVEVLRGEVDDLPPAPFRYRPLTPVLAAPLPFAPMTAINVVNVAALAAATFWLWRILVGLGVGDRRVALGCLMFVVSFPTFYYGTIGYVDPLAIALTMACVQAVLAGRHVLLLALVPLAALAREATVIGVVVAVVWLALAEPRRRVVIGWSVTWVIGFAATVVAVRWGLYGEGTNVWRPSFDLAVDNLSRPRTWMSAALTLGVPAVLIVVRAVKLPQLERRHIVFFGSGVLLCFGLFGYALFGAFADGRFLWPIYVFSVPFAVLLGSVGSVDVAIAAPGSGRPNRRHAAPTTGVLSQSPERGGGPPQ